MDSNPPDYNGGQPPNPRDLAHYRQKHILTGGISKNYRPSVGFRFQKQRFLPEKAPAKNRHFFHRLRKPGRGLVFNYFLKRSNLILFCALKKWKLTFL
jgi:hypothetical protein